MMLDTPYEGPLSYSERQRVIKKVAACLDSPLAASECTGVVRPAFFLQLYMLAKQSCILFVSNRIAV